MGAFEETKGKLKQAAGDITENPELQREGAAQQDKAEAAQDAQQARAEARAKEAAADEKEVEQAVAQREK